jgi:uncharacterized membrane protein
MVPSRYHAIQLALHLNPNRMKNSVNMSRWLAVGSLMGLIVLCVAWELFLAPLRPGGSWLVLKAGLLKNKMYTYRWVSLMVWLYFTEGAVRAYSDKAPSNYYALVEVLLCTTLFIACALHVRLRFKAGSRLPA